MRKLTGSQIRTTWIKFFESKGHKWLPGVSLIPEGDKSLLWVNAGVTGLKKYFDGSEIPPCRRIVNVQKSIRTNDIENVGHTARHHTFFEMLGNFSIGDYFRKEVIPWAYEILTDEKAGFGLDPSKLYATYNPTDLESRELWIKCGLKADHLIPLEGNYWQIGEGPCGPNTEVFYDRGEKYDPNHIGVKLLQDDMENDRYIELWGIVFSQFNAVNGVAREKYKELPSKNIDTGAGLERIACILQETPTNFETDLFMPIIREVEKLSGKKYEEPNLMSFRVIADHARCLTFALSDGASFSNEGRGYVLRRIIRRAMRYGQKLGIKKPFMHSLIKVVADNYKDFYPYLEDKVAEVSKMVLSEEEKFISTLTSGEQLLHSMLSEGKKSLSGEEVFKLYDTYGFPSDLTKEIALESGVTSDMEGFEKCMEEQRERARKARGEIESFHKQSKDLMLFKKTSEFLYDVFSAKAKVIGLFIDGVKVSELTEEGEAIFDKTPFYAEMGGEVSDKGMIKSSSFEGEVDGVSKAPNGQHLHSIAVKYGSLKVGDEVTLSLDKEARELVERNHSATHLLHSALKDVLGGKAILQKGSYVDEDKLRFDFGFDRKLTGAELLSIQDEVNAKISEGIARKTLVLPIEEAKKTGAEMEFSEKYGATVRVVTFGDYSKEFCGGEHVGNTSEIGLFLIKSEEAVSSGVRRIEALTSAGAYRYLSSRLNLLSESEATLNATDVDFRSHLQSLLSTNENLKKDSERQSAALASLEAKKLAENIEKKDGIDLVLALRPGVSRDDLLKFADSLKSNRSDYLIVLVGGKDGNFPVAIFARGLALAKLGAGDAMKKILSLCPGKGGGKPEMAMGSLKDTAKISEAFKAVKESV